MYPEEVRLFIDGKDVTQWAFGSSTINPTREKYSWTDIDITQFVRTRGVHIITLTTEAGVGRVEVIATIT